MLTRRRLTQATLGLLLLGLLLGVLPFILSLRPVYRIPAEALAIDISTLAPFSSRQIITHPGDRFEQAGYTYWRPGRALLLVRGETHDLYLYWLPIWQGRVVMPWKAWWQIDGYCPELTLAKRDEMWMIACNKAIGPDFLAWQWRWGIDGKNLGDEVPDLVRVGFIRERDTLYVPGY